MSYASRISDFINSITQTFGYAIPLTVLFFVYLLVRYPGRLVGTHGERPHVWTVPGYPLIGNLVEVAKKGVSERLSQEIP